MDGPLQFKGPGRLTARSKLLRKLVGADGRLTIAHICRALWCRPRFPLCEASFVISLISAASSVEAPDGYCSLTNVAHRPAGARRIAPSDRRAWTCVVALLR